MLSFLQDTFVTMFDGSPEKALRAVLVVMGIYVLTAAPLVTWVVYGLFQKDPKTKVTPEQTMQLIKSRRSVFPRDFTGQLVSRGKIEQMLEAANWAPTHGRTEPWRFVVLSEDALQDMIKLTDQVLHRLCDDSTYAKKKAKMQSKAATYIRATFIAICSKRQAKPEKLQPEWEELAATACAVQNMSLQGSALGVAGYWSSWQGEDACNSPEMKQFLGLEDNDRCLGFYIIGQGKPDIVAGYRSNRGAMSNKVLWK